MRLAGESVRFYLSPEGQQALRSLFPEGGPFRAYVVDEDELGVWILRRTQQLRRSAEFRVTRRLR